MERKGRRGMHVRSWRRWALAGLFLIAVAVAAGLTLGLLPEVLFLLATIAACSLSILPLIVDPPGRADRSVTSGRSRWGGRQEA